MRLSQKQSAILAALGSNPEITLTEAVLLIGGNLYCNKSKHVGAVLSNMVKRGMIERVCPGVFRLPTEQGQPFPSQPQTDCDSQFQLL